MAQHDLNIANATFPATRTDINNALLAIQTTHSGTTTPTNVQTGQIWLDTTSATTPTLKYYDGADNISLATLDHVGNTVNWLDSTVSITGLSTTATATVLTLTDSASTSTVNLIIDNQKEIRFRETTANGTNYVALKAPASVSADLTFTLPATDGTNGQALITNGSGVLSFTTLSADGTADWDTTVKTANFTAVSNKGYFLNTTSGEITVTLPTSPSAGDEIIIVDYAGTFATNNLIITSTPKINGSNNDVKLTTNREATRLVFIDSTQGYISYSGVNEGTAPSLTDIPPTYSIDFLVVAGGGSGGHTQSGGGGAGGYRTSTQTVTAGTVITVTVGDGGTSPASGGNGGSGSNSSISGSGLTTITSAGGGGGGNYLSTAPSGGSGGGAGIAPSGATTGGAGNTPSTSPSQGNNGGNGGTSYSSPFQSGGGGGADAVGNGGTGISDGNGGAGTASSITGSSVTRAGGGGGSNFGGAGGVGGSGGGGNGGTNPSGGSSGTVNTGGGGGGGAGNSGGAGGKGIVILSIPTASYSGTITGSPTESTSGSNKILEFTGSGSYTT